MASGNRSPGPRRQQFETEATYINLPRELVFLCKAYARHKRYTSLTLVVQTLLETHPDLVKFAHELYDGGNTSPPS